MKNHIGILLGIIFLFSSRSFGQEERLNMSIDAIQRIQSYTTIDQVRTITHSVELEMSFEMRKIVFIKKLKNHIAIQDTSGQYYLWSNEGKFMGKIGCVGNYPGEYHSVSDVVGVTDKEFFVYDNVRKVAIYYAIGDNKIECTREYQFNEFTNIIFDRIIKKDDQYFFFSIYGPEDYPKVYILDKNLKLVKSFHNKKHQGTCSIYGGLITSNEYLFMMDSFDLTGNSYFEPILYVYGIDGNAIRTINVIDPHISFIDIDVGQKCIIISYYEEYNFESHFYYRIFDINGNFITQLEDSQTMHTEDQIGYSYASDSTGKIIITRENNNYYAHFVEFRY